MIKHTYLPLFILSTLWTASCNKAITQPAINNDLATLNAPQGTTTLIEHTKIYKYATDEIIPKSTSTYTFNEAGNYLTIVHKYEGTEADKLTYSYDNKGRLLKIVTENPRYNNISTSHYTYKGDNPQTILITVENGKNYIPKIMRYYEGNTLVKEEIYNNDDVLRESSVFKENEITTTYYTNSGELSYKKVKQLKDGAELKSITYNVDGSVNRGLENEIDSHGNMTRSWTLDESLNRKRESLGYYYTYTSDTWILRIARDIRDYGSGDVANLKIREVKGAVNATIDEVAIKKAIKTINKN